MCGGRNLLLDVPSSVGGVTVFVTRILAVKYRICLPILSGNEEEQEG